MSDWLGYAPKQGGAHAGVSFLPFKRARAIVRKLKLGSHKEWKEWSKSGERPNNIPGSPERAYRDAGWTSMPDWLGYERRHAKPKKLPPSPKRAAHAKRRGGGTGSGGGSSSSKKRRCSAVAKQARAQQHKRVRNSQLAADEPACANHFEEEEPTRSQESSPSEFVVTWSVFS